MYVMTRLMKFFVRQLLRLLYRVEVSGMENYQKAGDRVLIIANHTSLLDGVLLYAWLPETPTFAINTNIAARKSFKPFLRRTTKVMLKQLNLILTPHFLTLNIKYGRMLDVLG